MKKIGLLALVLFCTNGIASVLPEVTAIVVRGSYAYTEDHLAKELFRILPVDEAHPNRRSGGFVSCQQRGKGIQSFVDCTVWGQFSLKSAQPKILRVEVSSPDHFLETEEKGKRITCEYAERGEDQRKHKTQICDLRLE